MFIGPRLFKSYEKIHILQDNEFCIEHFIFDIRNRTRGCNDSVADRWTDIRIMIITETLHFNKPMALTSLQTIGSHGSKTFLVSADCRRVIRSTLCYHSIIGKYRRLTHSGPEDVQWYYNIIPRGIKLKTLTE